MKFLSFTSILFLLNEITFHLVTGQAINEEKNDCTKYYNFIRGDNKIYSPNECCRESKINCEYGGSDIIEMTITEDNLASFPNFPNLRKLYLIENNIKILPEELFKLHNLEVLNIINNEIETIPSSISNLANLNNLNLDKNKIKNLPDELFKLPNLKILRLSSNQIDTIPSSINDLTSLNYLYLENNNIKNIPDELFELPHLWGFDISNNQIETVPSSINKIQNFTHYDFRGNNIKNFPVNLELYKEIDNTSSSSSSNSDSDSDDAALKIYGIYVAMFLFFVLGPILLVKLCCCFLEGYEPPHRNNDKEVKSNTNDEEKSNNTEVVIPINTIPESESSIQQLKNENESTSNKYVEEKILK